MPSLRGPASGQGKYKGKYGVDTANRLRQQYNARVATNTQPDRRPTVIETPPSPPPSTKGAQLNYNPKELIYNVGCVKDAYFRNSNGFFQEMSTSKLGTATDRPSIVTGPNQLWQNSGTNKGMITLFVPENSDPNVDGAVVPNKDSKLQPAEHRRYGFQFHYNPTTIKMDYAGAPNTDVTMEISGQGDNQEKFNLIGGQVNQSTISFDIVLNRVFDMNYYDATGRIKEPARTNKDPLYFPRMPENAAEEQLIFNKGTMYDLEFLLSTVIGYRLNTKFRGVTADVGWLSGRPVELYLGKSLRYVGFINAFSIQHQMFNERMVPIFTVANLNFNRIPDYAGM